MRYNEKTGTFLYKGDLYKEIELCKKEINRKTEELKIWEPVAKKMQYEVNSRLKRISECRRFIELAEAELTKQEKG